MTNQIWPTGVLDSEHPDHQFYVDAQAELDWIADGCPPVEGAPSVSEDEKAILLARPLNVRQAARREHCSERTIYRWLTAGDLPGVRVGRAWRIEPDALDARRIEASKPRPKAAAAIRRTRKRTATVAADGGWPS